MEISAQEMAEFQAFKERKAKEEAEVKAKEARMTYKNLVDEEIARAIELLLPLAEHLKSVKKTVFENFKTVLEMKEEVMNVTNDGQQTFTFTNTLGTKRIILGMNMNDNYLDSVDSGIQIVSEYIQSLGKDPESQALVKMVFRLLARDAKGTLKASRVMQLRRMADDSGNERFLEGVRIIEEAYSPIPTKQFIRAQYKGENGEWLTIPLSVTES